jgi:hypothetical protein
MIQHFVIHEEVLPHHSHRDLSQFQNGKIYVSIYPGLVGSYALNSNKNYLIDRLFCFYCCLTNQDEQIYLLYNISTCSLKILFISFFLYFLIVRKSIRTVMKENDGIMITRKFNLVAAKKEIF